MNFENFKKELKDIKFRSENDWELFLPYETTREDIQKILNKCREHLLLTWHIKYFDETEECPKPEICFYWDKKDLTTLTE